MQPLKKMVRLWFNYIADTEDTATYSVGTNYKSSITLQDDDDATLPTVSIAYSTSITNNPNITEGDDDAVFTITSSGGNGYYRS